MAEMLKTDGIERIVPAAETIRRVTKSAELLGVTRLADITGLDRIGIPVYSSVVPKSDDILSVYNGKGARRVDAQAGALMEAIERQTALTARPHWIEGSFEDLSGRARVLDPKTVNQKLSNDYSDQCTYAWIEGTELISGESWWVPAKLAGYLWNDVPHSSPFQVNDTNGLASGNCREEAVCHALCELVERDTWTFADLGAHQLPRRRSALAHGRHAKDGHDDLEMFPCVEVGSDELLDMFHAAGLYPVIRDITSELSVPTIFASVADEHIAGFPMAHSGLGTHPDAKVALRRALTELAQSRCVDIHGVREDIVPPGRSSTYFSLHTRRISAIDHGSWYLGVGQARRQFDDIPSNTFDSLETDIRFLLDRFQACGLDRFIVIDFTPEDAPYSVVRVIVPGVELWATDHGRLGQRAIAFWKQNV
jgi:ribosomal protein S12 methylthiotransferase accessory factor